jgi:predicted dehydrogenase
LDLFRISGFEYRVFAKLRREVPTVTRTIGIGVIGMGWMGTVHGRAYRQVPDRFAGSRIQPRLVICADDVLDRARSGQERFGFEKHTVHWEEVLANSEVEAVNIAAPNHLHRVIAEKAARAGKHIFCEKPVGRSPEDTMAIERAARAAGVRSFVGYNYRWAPLVQYARQLIERGDLGRLTHYRGRFFVGYGSNPHSVLSWRFQQELGGLGTLGDLMSHVIDMAHMIAGPIKRVIGNQETFIRQRPLATAGVGTHFTVRTEGPVGEVTNEDYVGALVQFANGAHGTLEACRVIQGPECQMAFEVHGTRGALAWDFECMNELRLFSFVGQAFEPDTNHRQARKPDLQGRGDEESGYRRILSGPQHPFHANFNPAPANGLGYEDLKVIEAHQFLKSIAEDKPGEPGFREALAVATVQSAIQRSWQSERWENVATES